MRWDDCGVPVAEKGFCEVLRRVTERGFCCDRYWSVFWLDNKVVRRVERFRVFEELRY